MTSHVEPPLVSPTEGRRVTIRGVVQGVGFRPWVYRIARHAGVTGRVLNDSSGVTIEAFGAHHALDEFLHDLKSSPPPAAKIRELAWESIPAEHPDRFTIVPSRGADERRVSIPPDLATCDECLLEIFDVSARRWRYPFTNCTNCGPRFTIVRDVPYDRAATTMAGFAMCEDCRREYENPDDRRFHAQPIACPRCGPKLTLLDEQGAPIGGAGMDEDALAGAVRRLRLGRIVAVKGLGGFHLACVADDPTAVQRLRSRKRRDAKPFAVMVRDLWSAAKIADLEPEERELLSSIERPIVLVKKRADAAIADAVAPDNPWIGLMLPYTPLHHLMLADLDGRPLVMTSGNLSDEPICTANDEAVARLAGVADEFLVHDRDIVTRCDDSVARVVASRPTLLRRSRGWVPRAIPVRGFAKPVLATGGQLKNVFCLGTDRSAFLGPHVGDLDDLATLRSFEESVERMQKLVGVTPAVIAHDMHPDYASTRWAIDHAKARGLRHVAVQHHHAHIAAAMAEHGIDGPVLGLAYDGTGYGTDGTAWGGEVLLADFEGFRRIATFRGLPLAGGERAIRAVWRIALAMLDDAFGAGSWPLRSFPLFATVEDHEIALVRRMIATRVNAPIAHGVGRWFDGFGALGLSLPVSRYEGEVALRWNGAAEHGGHGRSYGWLLDRDSDPWTIDLRPTVRVAAAELLGGGSPAVVAAKFHDTLVAASAGVAREALRENGKVPVVLSGGVFQNRRLAEGVLGELSGTTTVLLHSAVPPGDGGIALGQAAIANAVTRREG